MQPSCLPTGQPTRYPTQQPSSKPSALPTRLPSTQPSIRPTNQPTTQPTNPTGQPSQQPTTQPTSSPTVFAVVSFVKVGVKYDDTRVTPDGSLCIGDVDSNRRDVDSNRREGQPESPGSGSSPSSSGCSFREAINWCYTQPRWSLGLVDSCVVELPDVESLLLKAPIVFDPAAFGSNPVTIKIDGRGTTVLASSVGGVSGLFLSTNTTRQRYSNSTSTSSSTSSSSSSSRSSLRRLATANLGTVDPFATQLRSGFELSNVTLQGFGDPSRLGGAIRIENLGYFSLRNVIFRNNYGQRGGGAYVANVGVVSVTNVDFISNSATQSGGGLFIINGTTVRISNSRFVGNTATVVGAGAVVDHSMWASISNNKFTSNKAGGFGGGLSLNDLYGTNSYSLIANSTFEQNEAYFGSIVAMGKCLRISVDGIVARYNRATRGGGVFWLRSTMPVSPRNLLNNRSNIFEFNTAPYGPNYATEGRVMVAEPQTIRIVDYTARNKITASALVKDFYDQLVNDDSSTASVKTQPEGVNCRFNSLKAGVFGNVDAQVIAGVAKFGFKPVCIPGGSFGITYIMYMSRLAEMFPYYDAVQVRAPIKRITTDALVSFRNCLRGEKYDYFTVDKDSCTRCQDSYSMLDNEDLKILSCKPCPPKAQECYGDQIILIAGSWRWNNLATTIFTCPFTSFGCRGGNYSGQSSCMPGYHGPICGICDKGYFTSSDNSQCLTCGDNNFFSKSVIAILSVLLFLMGYAFWSLGSFAKAKKLSYIDAVFYLLKGGEVEDENYTMTKKDRHNKKMRRSWISRAKIFFTTYQVIISTPATFDINMGPLFSSFVNIMKVINFDFVSFLPVQCFQDFQFVQGMISSSGVPLAIVGSLLAMCSLQVWWQVSLETDPMRRRKRLGDILSRYCMVCVAIMSFLMTSVTAKVFKIFDCFDVDPNHEAGDGQLYRFLRVDVAVDCSSTLYKFGYSWALLMIVIYPIATPLFFFYLLYSNKTEIYGRGIRSRTLSLIEKVAEFDTGAEAKDAMRKVKILQDRYEKMKTA